jgi:hypothetical protein
LWNDRLWLSWQAAIFGVNDGGRDEEHEVFVVLALAVIPECLADERDGLKEGNACFALALAGFIESADGHGVARIYLDGG